MKKTLALILIVAAVTGMLAACSMNGTRTTTTATEAPAATDVPAATDAPATEAPLATDDPATSEAPAENTPEPAN